MINWVLSLLVHAELITEDEAMHLSKELLTKLHPQDFQEAHMVVEKLFTDLRKKQLQK